jgi:aldose 1-epimerase
MTAQPFGSARLFTLSNANGMRVVVSDYGGIIQRIDVPDRHGRVANVALGFGALDDYIDRNPFFGAIIGRFGNRIAHGKFSLDGTSYQLPINNGPHSLHGGPGGFHAQSWRVTDGADGLTLSHLSPDGDQGYPGNLSVTVAYTLTADNAIRIDYQAATDVPTIINLTNHTYFNLAGEGSGSILDHVVEIDADHYTPIDDTLIPTGAIDAVRGTPFDFSVARPIGERIRQGTPQLIYARGYDHNYVLRGTRARGAPHRAARVLDPDSGRVLEAWTTEPGLQFYTGNFLDGALVGTGGNAYRQGDGFTLETQHFPDSPNHPHFPTTELRPGQTFTSTTVFRFSVA